jgi:uncharacterized alkaline shock family protein YloU
VNRGALAVSRPVIRDLVRLAAMEVPGVLRVGWAGGPLRRFFSGKPIAVRVRHGVVEARVVVVARPGQPLATLAGDVQVAVAAAIERLLGMELGEVTVRIDGVGG